MALCYNLDTATFVDEIFKAIHTRSYSPRNLIPQSASSTSPTFAAPSGPAGAYGSLGVGRGLHGGYQESRKRSYNDRQEEGPGIDSHYSRGERQIKQMRRGGRGGRADAFVPRNGRGGFQESMYPQARASPVALGFQNMPMPPPFDPNDPLATIMAMQAMGLPPLPGMPPLPQAGSPNVLPQFGGQSLSPSHGPRRNTHRERCRDYDEKFFCERGDACPYEHGTDRLVASGQDGRFPIYVKWVELMLSRIRPEEFDHYEPAGYLPYVEWTRWITGAPRKWVYSRKRKRRPGGILAAAQQPPGRLFSSGSQPRPVHNHYCCRTDSRGEIRRPICPRLLFRVWQH